MNLRSGMRKRRDLPTSHLMDRIQVTNSKPARYKKAGKEKSLAAKVVVITLGLALSLGGVSAAVAIIIRGNSGEDNVVSLGVGKADANSCDTTTINTDTTSRWYDSYETFMIEKVELWGVDTACATKTLTLVMNYQVGYPDQTYTCVLPTTSVFTLNYNQATFIFASSAIATGSNSFRCFAGTEILTTTSILAGTGVQIL